MTTYSAFCDPGLNGCGVSVFADTVLLRATYVPAPLGPKATLLARHVAMGRAVRAWLDTLGVTPVLSLFKAEHPRFVERSHQKGSKMSADPNDLFGLTGVAGAAAALLPPTVELASVYPDEWKQQVDKFVMNGRVWKRLSLEERARAELRNPHIAAGDAKVGLDHNTYDGIGIGLHHLGRLERVRVFG